MANPQDDLHIRMLEKKLQQNYNPPWLQSKTFTDRQALVKELSDRLQQALTDYTREATQTNLVRIVVFCQKLKALGFHPSILGERNIPTGILVMRDDIWKRLQEVRDGNTNTPTPPNNR